MYNTSFFILNSLAFLKNSVALLIRYTAISIYYSLHKNDGRAEYRLVRDPFRGHWAVVANNGVEFHHKPYALIDTRFTLRFYQRRRPSNGKEKPEEERQQALPLILFTEA